MAQLDDLLKYKKKVILKNPRGEDIKAVWIRVLGDDDLKAAFQASRVASAEKRKQLRDKNSVAYKDEIVATLKEGERDSWEQIILASKENEFVNNAPIVVPREDAPKMEEIAVQPDAPTLEEQERLDAAEKEQDDKFRQALEEYIQTKLAELKAHMDELTDERVFEMATIEYVNIQALQAFLEELQDQKGFLGTYMDEACTERGYSTIAAYKNADGRIKAQIAEAYSGLELGTDDLKN